ncbi:MAG: hypothetical protein HZC49_09780 [Nitrospirae bacterium]|nr:hypothetical protein [Nitrospirota bacterium]
MARPKPLQCPFCDNYLRAPVDINFKEMELTGGICTCGAIYVYDRTGRNQGAMFMDALAFACKGDIDKSLSLDPGDYESVDYDYDMQANTIGRTSKAGKLVFVKLKKTIKE